MILNNKFFVAFSTMAAVPWGIFYGWNGYVVQIIGLFGQFVTGMIITYKITHAE